MVNDTFYKNTLDEYTASRPAYLIIGVDSYDELFNDMKDSEQAHELEAINTLLEEYIGRTTGSCARCPTAAILRWWKSGISAG